MHDSAPGPAANRRYTFRIFRFAPASDSQARFDSYMIELPPRTSVLEALLRLQADQDGSLAFRYSCRGAICGSCGMVINGTPNLACRVQVGSVEGGQIILEPLAKLEVLKDLIVDMEPFWSAYRKVEPWLCGPPPLDAAEHRMSEEQVNQVQAYANCILCACCYSACPVTHRDRSFIGPAAMTALYRHLADARDQRSDAFLAGFDSPSGLWGCDTLFRCCKACPKQVRPTDAIATMRRKWVAFAMRGLLGRIRWPRRASRRPAGPDQTPAKTE